MPKKEMKVLVTLPLMYYVRASSNNEAMEKALKEAKEELKSLGPNLSLDVQVQKEGE